MAIRKTNWLLPFAALGFLACNGVLHAGGGSDASKGFLTGDPSCRNHFCSDACGAPADGTTCHAGGRCLAGEAPSHCREAYDPCGGKSCGDSCTACDPTDPNCVEAAVEKFCDAAGQCNLAFPVCEDDKWTPCGGKSCGDSCTVCDPTDATCSETAVVKTCDSAGNCGPGSGTCEPEGCREEDCTEVVACPAIGCADPNQTYCHQRCVKQTDGSCDWDVTYGCDDPSTPNKWFKTCGDPVGGRGPNDDPSTPNCTTEQEGAACSTTGAECELLDADDTRLRCTDRDPRTQPGGCPISRRDFKQDIRYLDAPARERLAEELLGIHLATYRYKSAPAREQLGFIIEDAEPSASINSPRDMIDLYAYTSMAVAALQVQNEQLAALREEVAALRAARGVPSASPESDYPVCK